jgi:hypothetical protein
MLAGTESARRRQVEATQQCESVFEHLTHRLLLGSRTTAPEIAFNVAPADENVTKGFTAGEFDRTHARDS